MHHPSFSWAALIFLLLPESPIPNVLFQTGVQGKFSHKLKPVDGSYVGRATTKPILSHFIFPGAAPCYGTTRVCRQCSLVCPGAESQNNLCGKGP